jgi:hypothetical protein
VIAPVVRPNFFASTPALTLVPPQNPFHTGDIVRSDQIHLAVAQGLNRFEICKLTSKSVQALHKQGERMEDSINRALGLLRSNSPLAAADLIA